jgi:2-polyprenyl-6-methoxyphenol hydroxylase-like FAD-dependent oxidoreductase
LRERLAELGHQPDFGCKLTGFQQDEEGVTAILGEEAVKARYLAGADGGRSFVRQTLGIGFPGKTLGVRAIAADVVATGVNREAWHRFNSGSMETQIALCPLAGTHLFSLQAPIALEGDIDLSAAGSTALVHQRTGRADIVIHSVSWASAYKMNARLADRYRDGRVFLAGDAAHTHPPTGGQGLNTSVQDAYNLGWKLAAVLQGAPVALLDTYEQERRPIAAHMLGLATKLLEAAKAGSIRRGREVLRLDLCYPDSPLALEQPRRDGGLLAGDRAPDALLRRPSGLAIRLFDLFKGTHWTLLGYRVDRLSALAPRKGLHIHAVGPGGDIVDHEGHLRQGYGVEPGDWVLVRPDGYVGAIVSAQHSAALAAYWQACG